jgi:hypothetical protein
MAAVAQFTMSDGVLASFEVASFEPGDEAQS